MSDDFEPNINLNIQLNDMSPELKQVVFVLGVLLINVNIMLCLINLKLFVSNTYNSLRFFANKIYPGYHNGYNILNECENSV